MLGRSGAVELHLLHLASRRYSRAIIRPQFRRCFGTLTRRLERDKGDIYGGSHYGSARFQRVEGSPDLQRTPLWDQFTAPEIRSNLSAGSQKPRLHGRATVPDFGPPLISKHYRLDRVSFPDALEEAFYQVQDEIRSVAKQALGIRDEDFGSAATRFKRQLRSAENLSRYADIFKLNGKAGIKPGLKMQFLNDLTRSVTSESEREQQQGLADLRHPIEWYPTARSMCRKVHIHVGPTNSGKTYQALRRLEQAKSGVYAGPLRLLAHEVYTRLNASGNKCLLLTGDERKAPSEDLKYSMISSTVEMLPIGPFFDVAVIDEIQMIGDRSRGWAWTRALLGVRAREIHLCGEERTVPLLRAILASTGDEVTVHTYERLNALEVQSTSLKGNLNELRKGDCVVVFSVMGIHSMKHEIQKRTGMKVAIIYGSLPPETRAQQANLFNDPNNDVDILVASDAIGMGLNLGIKRIIFDSCWKYNGHVSVPLEVSQVKQIAGRAGRYRTAFQDTSVASAAEQVKGDADLSGLTPQQASDDSVGLVTTLDSDDYKALCKGMAAVAEPIRAAGLLAPDWVYERFAGYFPPGTPFSFILMRLHDLASVGPFYTLCDLRDNVEVADLIQSVEGLTTEERLIFCAAPADVKSPAIRALVTEYATCVAEQEGGHILSMKSLYLEILDTPPQATHRYLKKLEEVHKGLVLYNWLSYRFPGVFTTRSLAFHAKGLVEAAIEQTLSMLSFEKREAFKSRIRKTRSETANDDEQPQKVSGDDSQISEQDVGGQLEDASTTDTLESSLSTDDLGKTSFGDDAITKVPETPSLPGDDWHTNQRQPTNFSGCQQSPSR